MTALLRYKSVASSAKNKKRFLRKRFLYLIQHQSIRLFETNLDECITPLR